MTARPPVTARLPAPVRQLALPFDHAPEYPPHDFLHGPSNEAALAWLARAADWPDGRLVVWGEPGSGKTHLLHVWAADTNALLLAGAALDWTAALAGLAPIALDDADAAPEAALLHLVNGAAELGLPLLLAGRLHPARWQFRLADLGSRLRASAEVELRAPEDELLQPLFARMLAERQLTVPAPVQAWLLRHLPRSPAALGDAAFRLDRALLASGGRITRGLAASIVKDAV